ncbi:MAG: hypothetical protein J3Q66DRAFT_350546 [Benniella sp.]|nr:MAG: hypothetical protein J3Q66DRAFT_350546 [Benniella sp.]
MLGLPELDDIIFQQLGRHDLAQCARVNRKWHTAVIPYLWSDLSCLEDSPDTQRLALSRLVMEDYLSGKEQRRQVQGGYYGAKQSTHARLAFPLSTLAKYRPWIRVLPNPQHLFRQVQRRPQLQRVWDEQDNNLGNEPTEHELLLHLFKHCRTARLSNYLLHYTCEKPGMGDPYKAITEFVLPRVRSLSFRTSYGIINQEYSKVKNLLNQCPITLEKLALELTIRFGEKVSDFGDEEGDEQGEEEDDGDEQDEAAEPEWVSLKELSLRLWRDDSDQQPTRFWTWLFRRCGRVERLEITKVRGDAHVQVAEAMSTYMPHLTEITLGGDVPEDALFGGIYDNQVATLLSGSCKGWRVVKLLDHTRCGNASIMALSRHFSTLEELHVDEHGSKDLDSSCLLQVLSWCPKLHTLVSTDTRSYVNQTSRHFDANVFIDEDLDTGTLRPWACESSLKELKIKITSISREGWSGHGRIAVTYRDQERDVQSQVYDRLARLTRLETLWLGNRPHDDWAAGAGNQHDCLEMSLESGLYRLEGLKKLRELSVAGMRTRIGVKEVQWMVMHWPKLRAIYGLEEEGETKEAVEWLRTHHPRIEVLRLPSQQR